MTRNESMPKISKLDNARNRARSHDDARAAGLPAPEETTDLALTSPPIEGLSEIARSHSVTEWAETLAQDGWEAAPQLLTLEEGQLIHGILEGPGVPAEFTEIDPRTKESIVSTVQTWIVRSLTSKVRVSILSSAQLDKKLPEWIGCEVKIARGPEQKSKKGRGSYTEYLVAGRRRQATS